ncbi:S-layer homology domain-containing protein [Paenibacillus wenxiniae]|uniref:S-layer homology domain-containing protein n=1 Tax=Paenibacillus wenxiniae TaxID=1636843 RepID=A0ABW4RNW8_9BACL
MNTFTMKLTRPAWAKPRILACILLSSMLFIAAVPSVSAQSYLVQYTVYPPANNTALELAVVALYPAVPALERTSTNMQYSLDSTDGHNGVWNDANDGETPFTPSQGWLTLRLRNDPSSAFRLAYIDINASGSGILVQQGADDRSGQAMNGASPDGGASTDSSTSAGNMNNSSNGSGGASSNNGVNTNGNSTDGTSANNNRSNTSISTGTTTPATSNTNTVLPSGNGLYISQSAAPGQLAITLNKNEVLQQLYAAQDQIVPIVIPDGYTIIRCVMNGDVLQALYDAHGGIAIQSGAGEYVLPIRDIDPNVLSALLGNTTATSLQAMTLQIEITPVANEVATAIQQAASKTGTQVVGTPVQFMLKGSAGQQPSQTIDPAILFPATPIKLGNEAGQAGNGASQSTEKVATAATSTGNSKRQLILHPSGSNGNDGTTFTTVVRWNPALQQIIPVPTVKKANSSSAGGAVTATVHGAAPDGVYALVQHHPSFTDVAKHWSRNDVNDMASRLIVNGEAGKFVPDREVTRAEFAAMLVRALGLADEQSDHLPRDVKRSDWYAGVVGTAINHGLIEGYNDGNFRPNQPITREEAAMIISHAMNYTGQSTTLTDNDVQGQLNRFSDRSEVSGWAKKAVAVAAKSSIVGGDHGQFAPQSHVTRAQSASMIRRLLQKADWINE